VRKQRGSMGVSPGSFMLVVTLRECLKWSLCVRFECCWWWWVGAIKVRFSHALITLLFLQITCLFFLILILFGISLINMIQLGVSITDVGSHNPLPPTFLLTHSSISSSDTICNSSSPLIDIVCYGL